MFLNYILDKFLLNIFCFYLEKCLVICAQHWWYLFRIRDDTTSLETGPAPLLWTGFALVEKPFTTVDGIRANGDGGGTRRVSRRYCREDGQATQFFSYATVDDRCCRAEWWWWRGVIVGVGETNECESVKFGHYSNTKLFG